MLNQEPNDHTDAEWARREHDAEMGATSDEEQGWLNFCTAVERRLEIKTLDGDERADGYSIDAGYDAFSLGWSPQMYADAVKAKRAEMGR